MNQRLIHSLFTVYNNHIKEVNMEKLAIGLSLLAMLYLSLFFISGYITRFLKRSGKLRLPDLLKKLNLNRILEHDFQIMKDHGIVRRDVEP